MLSLSSGVRPLNSSFANCQTRRRFIDSAVARPTVSTVTCRQIVSPTGELP